jgi:hypothetical protein
MVIDRRTFIQSAAFLSAGGVLFYSADVLACVSPTVETAAAQTKAETDAKLAFKIDGWERGDHHPGEHPKMSTSKSTHDDFAGDEVFIQVNRAWRTAWR